jgi:hypothetical protein
MSRRCLATRHIYWITLLLLSLCISCSSDIHPIETKSFSEKNPTSYEFARPMSEVKQAVLSAFDTSKKNPVTDEFHSSFSTMSFFFVAESKEDALFSKHVFENPENSNDLYLHSYGEPISHSFVYSAVGDALKYRATFQLHLTAPTENSTKVSVITHNPTVINGSKCCGLHGYVSNDVPVEPTTIEEYKILLFVGRLLGAQNMPPLRLPEEK